ncbi:MAG: hemolysin family protein [Candidatus Kapaibacteriota bacterium]|jgi:CBS domain containing-hemolysin-like protein
MISDILLTLFFVFLNGFFVAAEFAIVKVRHSLVEIKSREGNSLAKITLNILNNLDAYLSATQLGITLASLGLGWIGESVVSSIIIGLLDYFGFHIEDKLAHQISLPIAFLTITILHIVFGELAPKTVAIQRPEQTSFFVSLPLVVFYNIFKPFIWSLNKFANYIVKLMGFGHLSGESGLHTSEEIRYLIQESDESSGLSEEEKELLENVFEFSETPIRKIMIPRNKMIAIEQSMKLQTIIDLVIEEGYSRLPVYNKSLDNIVGIIYTKDLLTTLQYPNLFVLADLMRPAFFVDETEMIKTVLDRFKVRKIHIAIVRDEFGGTAGLVTLEDIIEEIVGEIQDEYDEEKPLVEQINENEFIVSAGLTIEDVNEYLQLPIKESEDYDTVGGYILNYSGKIPAKNEIVELEDYNCLILESSDRRIETVKLIKK